MFVVEGVNEWHARSLRTTHAITAYTHGMAFFARSSSKKSINLFGFPTTVRPGFVVFLAILALLYPFPLGFWIAGTVAVFTVVHELGHAVAARRAGCQASIAMDFMVAYAAYESPRPLPWRTKIAIALAGPLLQMTTALGLLVAMGINPASRSDIGSSDATLALWWAGFALGAINLIPLLPLDGGAVVAAIAERVSPAHGRDTMLRVSIGVTAGLAGASVVLGFGALLPLFVLMLIMQWQSLAVPKKLAQLARDPSFSSGGDLDIDSAIIASLIEQGEQHAALAYCRRAYAQCPAFSTAVTAAQVSITLADAQSALSWLDAAEASQIDRDDVRQLMGDWMARALSPQGHPSLHQWLSKG